MKLKIKTSRDFDLTQTEPDEPLFSKPKGGPGRFVMRHGKLVPKHSVNNTEDVDDKRSDLPSPMLAPRFPEHRNMATGEMVDDRRKHREILKRHNLTEVGNEYVPGKKADADVSDIRADIKETMEQYEQDFDFRSIGIDVNDETSYERESDVTFEAPDIDLTTPDQPQYIRSNSKSE
jgi:hypothetical protein